MILRLYALLLRLYPQAFRERYGAQMTAAFAELAAERRQQAGVAAFITLLVGTVRDVVLNAVAEHRAQHVRRVACISAPSQTTRRQRLLDGLVADARFARRSMTARPAAIASIVLTLTVGTGAATSIFSVVDAVLLRPLPYPDDAQLVAIADRHPKDPSTTVSFHTFADWQRLPALSHLAAFTPQMATITHGTEPERVTGEMVSPAFFDVLGVAPMLGRTFHSDARWFDPDQKIVLSHALWLRQFAGDPSVVGRQVSLDGKPHTCIGVMPRGFAYPAEAEYWTSLPPDMIAVRELRAVRFLQTVGRLRDGVTVETLQSQLGEVAQRSEAALPAAERGWRGDARTLREQTVGSMRRPLALVLGAVALLTVVGCCNAAAMLLARGTARSGEIALRAAVGASRGRIVRQLLLESLMIASVAALLGTLLASSLLSTIAAFSLGQVPRIDTIEINARVLSFVAVFTLLLVALFGAIPSLALSRVRPTQAINATRWAGANRRRTRALRILVVVECAMALVILAGGGLLINSFVRLTRVGTGVDPANVLTAKVGVPLTPAWGGDAARRRLHEDLISRVTRLPDVRAAAVASRLPLGESRGGAPVGTTAEPQKLPRAIVGVVSEDYFNTVGARLLAGRTFSTGDTDKAPGVAVVNETMAAVLWPGQDAIGKTVIYRHWRGTVRLTVVGVVSPIRYDGLAAEYKPELFITYRQTSVVPLQLVVRTGGDPLHAVAAIRTQARHADPTGAVTIDGISTLERRLASAAARPRFFAVLLGTFAAAALLMSALGVHGVFSFWTEQRRQEFGVRVALGASRSELYRQVLGQGALLAAVGVVVGVAASLSATRIVSGLLFGITAWDPVTYITVSTLMVVTALAACFPAARRAASVDPVQMLRAS